MSRIDQINHTLQKELSLIIAKEAPVEGAMVTISRVDVSPDMKSAHIFFTVLPENFAGTALKKLDANKRMFIQELRKRIKIKWIPEIVFQLDEGAIYANQVEEILGDIKREKEDK